MGYVSQERLDYLREQYKRGNLELKELTDDEFRALGLRTPHPWNIGSVEAHNRRMMTGEPASCSSEGTWQTVSGLVFTIGGCPIVGIPLLLWGLFRAAKDD